MELNQQQLKIISDYLKNNLWEYGRLYTDIFDHFCCLVEHKMTENMSFETAFDDAKSIFSKNEIENMQNATLESIHLQKHYSPKKALLATTPILVMGMNQIALEYFPKAFEIIGPLIGLIAFFITLAIGWVRNFPRWVFPALSFTFCTSIFVLNYSWKVILMVEIPILLSFLVAVIINPSPKPLQNLIDQVWEEPSTLLLFLLGFMPWFILVTPDEVYNPQVTVPYIISSMLILIGGVFFFLYSKKKIWRIVSALSCMVLLVIACYIFIKIAWNGNGLF